MVENNAKFRARLQITEHVRYRTIRLPATTSIKLLNSLLSDKKIVCHNVSKLEAIELFSFKLKASVLQGCVGDVPGDVCCGDVICAIQREKFPANSLAMILA